MSQPQLRKERLTTEDGDRSDSLGDRLPESEAALYRPMAVADNDRIIEVSNSQHREVMEKMQEIVNALHGITAGFVTVFYLALVSYFFWIGKITEWIWVPMTLAGMTQFLGEKVLNMAFLQSRRGSQ
jgi:hypothetical protein